MQGSFCFMLLLMPASSSLQGSLLSHRGYAVTGLVQWRVTFLLSWLPSPFLAGCPCSPCQSVLHSSLHHKPVIKERSSLVPPSPSVLQVSSGGLSKRRSQEGCAEDLFMLALYTLSPTVRVEGKILASAPDLGVRRPERSEMLLGKTKVWETRFSKLTQSVTSPQSPASGRRRPQCLEPSALPNHELCLPTSVDHWSHLSSAGPGQSSWTP